MSREAKIILLSLGIVATTPVQAQLLSRNQALSSIIQGGGSVGGVTVDPNKAQSEYIASPDELWFGLKIILAKVTDHISVDDIDSALDTRLDMSLEQTAEGPVEVHRGVNRRGRLLGIEYSRVNPEDWVFIAGWISKSGDYRLRSEVPRIPGGWMCIDYRVVHSYLLENGWVEDRRLSLLGNNSEGSVKFLVVLPNRTPFATYWKGNSGLRVDVASGGGCLTKIWVHHYKSLPQ